MKRLSKMCRMTVTTLLTSWLILSLSVAQAKFNNGDLAGRFGLAATGTITATGLKFPVGTPLIATGLLEFDGQGGCRGIDQINIGGTVIPESNGFRTTAGDGNCIYTVNPDGTGFVAATFGPSQPLPGTIEITFVLIGDGTKFSFITTNTPGFSASGTFTQQDGAAR